MGNGVVAVFGIEKKSAKTQNMKIKNTYCKRGVGCGVWPGGRALLHASGL
jgi:hypothetical protein